MVSGHFYHQIGLVYDLFIDLLTMILDDLSLFFIYWQQRDTFSCFTIVNFKYFFFDVSKIPTGLDFMCQIENGIGHAISKIGF